MKDLHIVTFDVPFPPTYGGRIDVFYRIKALAERGVRVHLHCFLYGDNHPSDVLRQLCKSVYYYHRVGPLGSLPLRMPHIVASRRSEELLRRLVVQEYPILFEGLHTCYYLAHPSLARRTKLVRMHNIEHEYYAQLAAREPGFLRKQYLRLEAFQLRQYEAVLEHASYTLAISPRDGRYLGAKFPHVFSLPPFHPHTFVNARTGSGSYALYHGNLAVAENHEAALWLIREVFSHMEDLPLIIAGANPRPELIAAINAHAHISLRHNPSEQEMMALMQQAHVHALPTFQPTGIKLKLLNALFAGRHIVANSPMAADTGVESLCVIADTPQEFRQAVRQVYGEPFTAEDIARRIAVLGQMFSNAKNAADIVALLP